MMAWLGTKTKRYKKVSVVVDCYPIEVKGLLSSGAQPQLQLPDLID